MQENKNTVDLETPVAKPEEPVTPEPFELETEPVSRVDEVDHKLLVKMYQERKEGLKKISELEKRVDNIRKKISAQEELTPAQIREQIARDHNDQLKARGAFASDEIEDNPEEQADELEERIDDRMDQIMDKTTKLTDDAIQQFGQVKEKAASSVDQFHEKMQEDPQTTIKEVIKMVLMIVGALTLLRNLFKN